MATRNGVISPPMSVRSMRGDLRRWLRRVIVIALACVAATPAGASIRLDLGYVDKGSKAYARFRNYVDQAVAQPGKPPYGFSATDAVYMARLEKDKPAYCGLAVSMVEAQVAAANTAIASGKPPAVAADSYLLVGTMIGDLAMTLDVCAAVVSSAQRSAWTSYAEQAVANVWDHDHASWGGRPFAWTGWSTDDPGDNYYYSFLGATMLWALASDSERWMRLLTTDKLPALERYMVGLPGGGSLEGTGYGVAHMRLFTLYRLWRHATGQDLANANAHLSDSIEYWVHATVPTLDAYAPIGDQSRSSQPTLYDYHRILMLEALALTAQEPSRRHASWWLGAVSVPSMTSDFNARFDLLPPGTGGAAPSATNYLARGVGTLFARTGWDRDALWMAFVAGPYNQSHAHEEQGGFSLYRRQWLAVSANIGSHSGIQQGSATNNILRFDRNGVTIRQRQPSVSMLSLKPATGADDVHGSADLGPAYPKDSGVVAWRRDFDFAGGALTVRDRYEVGAGVVTTFQVNVPAKPVVDGNRVRAGDLDIEVRVPAHATIRVVEWTRVDPDFLSGWRVDIQGDGDTFDVRLGTVDRH